MTETTKKPTTRKKATSASASAPTSIASKRKAAAPKAKAAASVKSITHEEIAKLAHRFWNERGRQHGHDAEDWLRAEQTLLGKAS
jgi:hypothetical protein